MPVARACSECGYTLAGRPAQTKTCSDKCRSTRSRRVRRANREMEEFADANNAGAEVIAQIVRNEAPDLVTKVMKEQLTPIVREALTEDTLRAINDMVGLTPRAVAAMSEDLDSEDPTIRQRAYTLLIKYTVGHPAIVKPQEQDPNQVLEVHFNLPRPDATVTFDTDAEDAIPELMTCDVCGESKPREAMAAVTSEPDGTGRCMACHEARKAAVLEQLSV